MNPLQHIRTMELVMFMVICLPYIVRSNRFEDMMEELRNLERNGDTGTDNSGNDVPAERTQLDSIFHVNVCENDHHVLSCQDGRTIRIMDANFGRKDSTTCPGANRNKRCYTTFASQIVASKCYRRQYCRISASTRVFGYPRNCRNTYKYLYVKYQCESTSGR